MKVIRGGLAAVALAMSATVSAGAFWACAGAPAADEDVESTASAVGGTGVSGCPGHSQAGANGPECSACSPYDCLLGPEDQRGPVAANRVIHDVNAGNGKVTWSNEWNIVAPPGGFLHLDGNGNAVGTSDPGGTFNYGTERTLTPIYTDGGKGEPGEYIFALAAGWVSLDTIPAADQSSFLANLTRNASTAGRRPATGRKWDEDQHKLLDENLSETSNSCYEVRDKSPSESYQNLRVVSGVPHALSVHQEAVNNYGGNMVFNVTKGTAAVDYFKWPTRFTRLAVPTWAPPGHSSQHALSMDLWSGPGWDKNSHGSQECVDACKGNIAADCSAYHACGKSFDADEDCDCKPAGQLTFIYGVVHTTSGDDRYGWMALTEALVPCDEATPSVTCTGDIVVPNDSCPTLLDCCEQTLQSAFETTAEYESFESTCHVLATDTDACGCGLSLIQFKQQGHCG